MTRVMYDSVTVGAIPRRPGAVLLYIDGRYRNWQQRWRFRANKLSITVLGNRKAAAADCEPGNIDATGTALWARDKIRADPHEKPVCYGSRDLVISGGRRYGIPAILQELKVLGVRRDQVRILSAHYGMGPHICGPKTCGASFQADGTQWTDQALGRNLDESLLADDFFPTKPKRKIIPKPKPIHKKAAGTGLAAGLATGILALVHGLGVHLTPAESGAIDAVAAMLGAYIAPAGYIAKKKS